MDFDKLKTPREQLQRAGQAALKANAEAKTGMRITAVVLAMRGMEIPDIANLFNVSERSITNWIKIADEQGFGSLYAKKQTGAPPKLTSEMIEKINCVLDKDPNLYGFKVWDGPTLREFIRKEFGIDYSVRSCQYLLHNLDRSLVRPQIYPALINPDETARNRFKAEIKRLMKDKSKVIVFQDEVHFCAQTTVTRMWVRKGSKPRIKSKPGKQSIAYSGFLIPETGSLHLNKPEWFNYETVIESVRDFLRDCPPPEGKKYVIVLDNAPWHKKAVRLLQNELDYEDVHSKVDLLFLPPYSPDLNPIEQVWRITRREVTHNRYFHTLEFLVETLDGYYCNYSTDNDKLKSLCSFDWFAEV